MLQPNQDIQFLVVDLFCGFGGVTQGFEQARPEEILKSLSKKFGKDFSKIAHVIGCVNHDPKAILSHWKNFKHVEHFEEDIRKLYGVVIRGILFKSPQLIRLEKLVNLYRLFYPNAKLILWSSLECVNFSKAKGGISRDQDSRTLADHLFPYIFVIDPDLIMIENVVEFMAWGPMIPKVSTTAEGYKFCPIVQSKVDKAKKKKPKLKKPKKRASKAEILDWEINMWELMEKWRKDNQRFFTPHWIPEKTKNGIDWLKWCSKICSLGYRDDWKQMNSANFGAYTSRNRLFGVFAKKSIPIVWPSVTHAKNPDKTFVGGRQLKKWNAVKDLLDFSNEGNTIFNRKKPLETTTMERLFKGSVKHIAGGKDAFNQAFISRYYSGNPEHRNHTVDEPAGTLTTNNRLAIVSHSFISKYFSGHPESKSSSIDSPASTIKPKDNQALVNTISFIDQRNGGNLGHKSRSIDLPSKTLTQSGGNQQLVNADILKNIDKFSEDSHVNFLLNQNVTHDKFGNPSAHFLQKYYSNGGQFNGIDEPAATISTRDRLSKVSAQFIDRQFSQGKQNQTIDEPLGAITTVPKANYIQADFFIDKQYSGVENNQPISQPAGTITTNDKHCLVHAEKWLMNTNFNNVGSSLEGPAPVITASRHHHYIINPENSDQSMGHLIVAIDHFRTPLYYIVGVGSPIIVPVYEGDCVWTIKLKEFMVLFQIVDIKMRMLVVDELIQIQGFPKDYIMIGSNTDKKKFIGNSVVPAVVEHWILAYSQAVFADEYERFRIAA